MFGRRRIRGFSAPQNFLLKSLAYHFFIFHTSHASRLLTHHLSHNPLFFNNLCSRKKYFANTFTFLLTSPCLCAMLPSLHHHFSGSIKQVYRRPLSFMKHTKIMLKHTNVMLPSLAYLFMFVDERGIVSTSRLRAYRHSRFYRHCARDFIFS